MNIKMHIVTPEKQKCKISVKFTFERHQKITFNIKESERMREKNMSKLVHEFSAFLGAASARDLDILERKLVIVS